MTLGEKIYQLRKSMGISQEELALQMAVSRQAISKWELGEAVPDVENVIGLSKIFEVSTDYIIKDDADEKTELPDNEDTSASRSMTEPVDCRRTKRPCVSLKSKNELEELMAALNKSLYRFTSLDGTAGVVLNGGLSRGYGDHHSEIDILIFLHEKQFEEYNNGNYPFALGITMIDGYLYDIKSVCYEHELEKEYDSTALWDLSYAKILYDPEKLLSKFVKRKLSKNVDMPAAGGFMWSAYWSYKLAGDIWIHRQDTLQGHFTLSNAIKPLISALFVANGDYIPHEKWFVHMSKSLVWKPKDWETRLVRAMSTGDFSVQSLKTRQTYIEGLWNDIDARLCEMVGFKQDKLNFTQMHSYQTLSRLLAKSSYTIAEWEEVSGLDALNYEPIHSVFKRHDNLIVFDKDRFQSLKPEEMYVWMYDILDSVRK